MYSHPYLAQAMAQEHIIELRRSARPRSAKQQLRVRDVLQAGRFRQAWPQAALRSRGSTPSQPCPTC